MNRWSYIDGYKKPKKKRNRKPKDRMCACGHPESLHAEVPAITKDA